MRGKKSSTWKGAKRESMYEREEVRYMEGSKTRIHVREGRSQVHVKGAKRESMYEREEVRYMEREQNENPCTREKKSGTWKGVNRPNHVR
ncbi:hypothetical protein KFZ56_18255 [Virgibacillus sp. NKC19-3]|uniref:hypothetical protein n=1 Tax=Virgibacillus saliphilus TaxID=2831674 RepID=UPI001C9AD74E|nr:hypothetical protein [Virgibacillus sp. NKC19-3]MBY7144963.1 hypothetical protein [Virgibacillus sp. NKC19-3]